MPAPTIAMSLVNEMAVWAFPDHQDKERSSLGRYGPKSGSEPRFGFS
jgi:hypothetical protein